MNSVKTNSIVTLVLSILSIIALVFSHLALTDIYHQEEDLTLEWTVLQISAIVFIIFITYTIFTLKQVLKKLN